jgi:3-oxoacyl-[acyl-carrier protein] reductase
MAEAETGSRFAGKVAFITGAAQGIGETYARMLAAEGASIAIADVNETGAKEIAASIAETGARAIGLACDITDEDQIDSAVADTTSELGGIDILINNAAKHLMEYNAPCAELPLEKWRLMMDVNVVGIVACSKACRPSMRERGGGAIINMSSIAGFASTSPYGVSKLAVRGLTVALAKEFAPDGIRVNGIAPGIVDSPAAMADVPREMIDQFVEQHQLIKRPGRMTDLVNALFFLCGEESSFITGETLLVSGGYPSRV